MAHTITTTDRTAEQAAAKCSRELYLAITGNLVARSCRAGIDPTPNLAHVRSQLIALDPDSPEADAVLYAASRSIGLELAHVIEIEADA